MDFKKNDIIELEIIGMTSEGSGVGKHSGVAVIVPFTAVGDKIKALIIKIAKNYAVGKLYELLEASQDRLPEKDCPAFNLCGGCQFRHIKYESELETKEQRVRDAITRIGGLEGDTVKPIIKSPSTERYRNKAQIPLGRDKDGHIVMGFFSCHSHRIISCEDCLLAPPIFSEIEKTFKSWCESSGNSIYDEKTGKGLLRHLYLRTAEKTGEISVCVVSNGRPKNTEALCKALSKFPSVSGILLNENKKHTNVILGDKFETLYGKDYIEDEICSLKVRIKPLSFYQVNRSCAEILYNKAAEYAAVTKSDVLLDLYCGTGTIGLTMAKSAKMLYGAEIVEDAVKDAGINAAANGIENARFICMDAAKAAEYFEAQNIKPDVITVDPPRKGCSADLIESINRMEPKRVVYISCDPATLARDLKIFSEKNFSIKEITPVDMFPRTANVECVTLMSRVEK